MEASLQAQGEDWSSIRSSGEHGAGLALQVSAGACLTVSDLNSGVAAASSLKILFHPIVTGADDGCWYSRPAESESSSSKAPEECQEALLRRGVVVRLVRGC